MLNKEDNDQKVQGLPAGRPDAVPGNAETQNPSRRPGLTDDSGAAPARDLCVAVTQLLEYFCCVLAQGRRGWDRR